MTCLTRVFTGIGGALALGVVWLSVLPALIAAPVVLLVVTAADPKVTQANQLGCIASAAAFIGFTLYLLFLQL